MLHYYMEILALVLIFLILRSFLKSWGVCLLIVILIAVLCSCGNEAQRHAGRFREGQYVIADDDSNQVYQVYDDNLHADSCYGLKSVYTEGYYNVQEGRLRRYTGKLRLPVAIERKGR